MLESSKNSSRVMKVIKRDGRREDVSFDKVINRIKFLCQGITNNGQTIGPALEIDPIVIAQKVINEIRDGITTRELDEFAADTAASMIMDHPDYGILSGRISVSNHHKNQNTMDSFTDTIKLLYENKDVRGNPAPLIDRTTYKIAINNRDKIQEHINYINDYYFDYFGFKTIEKSYLIKQQTGSWRVLERPQHMWMRVSIGFHREDLEAAFETYDNMAAGYFTMATPTLFLSGTPRPQMSSCFLMGISDDMEGIYKCLQDCALISKSAGGIGVHISNIRSKASLIRGTNGKSNGIVPMLRVFNDTARYVDQCFAPDTLVYTPNGSVAISELSVGDNVITHDGSPQVVERVLCHEVSSEVFRIYTESSTDPTVVTGEHQILVLKNDESTWGVHSCIGDIATLHTRLDNGYAKFSWADARELNTGDWICLPVDSLLTGFPSGKLPDNLAQGGDTNLSILKWGGMSLFPIQKIEVDDYNGKLYDLEVANNHTYITSGLGIVHNGGGKRMGSFAIYLEPWHPEIMEFLELKKNSGKEELRARDLFYAMWMPDLFMKRLKMCTQSQNTIYWSCFCPDECPGLNDVYGEEFEALYHKYESEGKARVRYDIMDIWNAILTAQKESGTPYMVYKDHANRKSNQKNLGTIKSSNLCAEIIEYSDNTETAVCNLSSIGLPMHVIERINPKTGKSEVVFDFERLFKTAKIVTRNLNKVIDINYYPTPEAKKSNMRNRPIGIGVQGLADVFIKMRYPFDSPEAAKLNVDIFETIYFGAVTASNELAEKYGTYETYEGSPASEGKLQFDLWGVTPSSGMWDWKALKEKIAKYGLRNSLLTAQMPTASTAQILGNCESIEPYTYNVYIRRVLAGEIKVVNKHMQRDLLNRGLWTPEIRAQILADRGSIANIDGIPDDLKALYKTSFELSQKVIIQMARDRGPYIDQSQSMNIFMKVPTDEKLTAMHLMGWEAGLKTGMYYLRREPIKNAQQFTVAPQKRQSKVIKSDGEPKDVVTTASEESHEDTQHKDQNQNLLADIGIPIKKKLNGDQSQTQPKLCLLEDPTCLSCGS